LTSTRITRRQKVDFTATYRFSLLTIAPTDHLHINLRAAWNKANAYFNKLDDSLVYYAVTCLHPLYKYYCENS
jgi:hypothetical protein